MLVVAALSCACPLGVLIAACDDDQIVVLSATPDTNEHDNLEANFDRWVFAGAQSAAAGRKRMEAQAKLKISEIERSCRLSSEQKSQLELAARGDFERFNERAEFLRRKYAGTNVQDNEKMNQFWQEFRPLQTRQSRGVAGPDTLLAKALARTLDAEQTKEFDANQGERRRFRYQASIALALHMLELSAPMSSEQRDKLTQLLLALPPPRIFGQMDQWVVSYRLSMLSSQAAVKDMLEPRQWQALAQPLAQAKGYKSHLLDLGYLVEDLDLASPATDLFFAKPAEVKP
jgi:hypothetical protein